ncbi:winged helix DNA-binding protein [Sphingomonas sp. PR090111-T3T-6A]|uniref:winged helix DNA-binding protein n=1 Tax=Sphingomonas sp. PR090111-T3T-6A TaxID=685778 RepID=UPI00035F7FDF|nr:winged helix DNA-binding protein [Sphingomonas sp. PR090111-T3T-6A]
MNAQPADILYDRSCAPAVLLFGDDAARRARLADRIILSGGRVSASEPIDTAADRLDSQSGARIVVDLREDGGAALDGLLMWLDAQAGRVGSLSTLILTPPGLIDVVTARIADIGVRILVDPEPGELEAALEDLLSPPPPLTSDSSREEDQRLSDEVGLIARRLPPSAQEVEPMVEGSAADARLVQAMLRLRRLRGQHFVPSLFADPAWDILLDLMGARLGRRSVSASSLCIAAAVPATTALRWIAHMTKQELLVRRPDPRDGRRVFIALSEQAAAVMHNYLAAARRIVAPAG